MIAMPLSIVAGGVVKFLLLSGNQGFPLLAMSMAPVIMIGCFLCLKPKTFTIGFILIVFFPNVLGPSNPQSYDPQSYVDASALDLAAAFLLALTVRIVLPTTDAQRRRWSLFAARDNIVKVISERRDTALRPLGLEGDRLIQFLVRPRSSEALNKAGLHHAIALSGLHIASVDARSSLLELRRLPEFKNAAARGLAGLRDLDTAALKNSALAILAAANDGEGRALTGLLSAAVSSLALLADIIPREQRIFRRMGLL
jgi:uncharacterized membrane protein YccC